MIAKWVIAEYIVTIKSRVEITEVAEKSEDEVIAYLNDLTKSMKLAKSEALVRFPGTQHREYSITCTGFSEE